MVSDGGIATQLTDYVNGEIHTSFWEDNSGHTPPDTLTKFIPEDEVTCKSLGKVLH